MQIEKVCSLTINEHDDIRTLIDVLTINNYFVKQYRNINYPHVMNNDRTIEIYKESK